MLIDLGTRVVEDVPDAPHGLGLEGHEFGDGGIDLGFEFRELLGRRIELFQLIHGRPFHEFWLLGLLFPGLMRQDAEDETDAEAEAD